MGVITPHNFQRLFLLSLLLASPLGAQNARIRLERVATGIGQCSDIQSAKDGSGRLFLVRQQGTIHILRGTQVLATPFLDIRGRLSTGGERGLLGLAFPPDYASKRYFYINYTNTAGSTVVSRFRLLDNDRADAGSEQILLTINQPFSNHNGGQLQFGPDGFLYIGMGDGGSANDPQGHGQNPRSLLGKMLRIDTESQLTPYRIPASNPFATSTTTAPEIWASGLRNPWRFSFDRATGDLYMADVGQNAWEEIDFQPGDSRGGENYGWVTMEGRVCVRAGCNQTGLTLPVHVYPRTEGLSVTGGYVYRGNASPNLRGAYIYGDFVTGRFWGLRQQAGAWVNDLLLDAGRSFGISTFGEDEAGEVYVANYSNGEIFRIAAATAPVFSSSGVVNAASFRSGLVPGSLATLFSTGLLSGDNSFLSPSIPLARVLGGVRLRINGADAPLLALVKQGDSEQLNFQVPWELSPGSNARLQINGNGVDSETIEVPVVAAAPGIFGPNSTDALLIRASNFSLVGPAEAIQRNEAFILYSTGLGPFANRPATGAASSAQTPITALTALSLGGVPCEILYAGNAPGFVGVYQINFRPGNGTPGGVQELLLRVDNVAAPARAVRVAP
jgi:uncharacterized protein (TIGR03437 family)